MGREVNRVFVQTFTVKLQPLTDENNDLFVTAHLDPEGQPIICDVDDMHPAQFVSRTFAGFTAGCFWDTGTGRGQLFTSHDGMVQIRGNIHIEDDPSGEGSS